MTDSAPLVYLDTCILSRLLDPQRRGNMSLKSADISALEALSQRDDLRLVTSEKTLEEVRATQAREQRIALTMLYRFIDKISTAPLSIPTARPMIIRAAGRGGAVFRGSPGVLTDREFTELTAIFDQIDAEHLLNAARGGCDYFLTTDKATIIDRAGAWSGTAAAKDGMLIVSPTQLMKTLSAAGDQNPL